MDSVSEKIDTLESAAKRQALEERAAHAVSKARVRLILDKSAKGAFFATLALRLNASAEWSIETMATDGKRLLYNPAFVEGLSKDELLGVVCHEVMHCAMSHFSRRGSREHKLFNVACDLAINGLIVDSGYSLPACALMPAKGKFSHVPEGLSAEEYYGRMKKESPGEESGQGNDPGGCGEILDAGDKSQQRQVEADWKVAVNQAENAAKQRGQLPGGLGRTVREIVKPSVDWREILREFVRATAKNDYSWSRPNRRFIHQGIYLPGMHSEEIGELILAIDVSGSIGERELKAFQGELNGVLEQYPVSVTVLYHDTAICHEQNWTPSDGELSLDSKGKGGGGTDHEPLFDRVSQMDDPACVICLTDLETSFPKQAPNCPVLWACTQKDKRAPFGQVVHVKGAL